jgi:hypothetical protein
MGATLGRIVSDYRSLVEICQRRAVELEISRLELDRLSGVTSGYCGKILGNGNSKKQKRLWPIGMEAILGALGLKILVIEDEAATARTLQLRVPVKASHQRFGNKSNSPRQIEKAENVTYTADAPASPPAPPTVSHLRVIQTKGRKYG